MTNVSPENPEDPTGQTPGLDDVIDPGGSALPPASRRGHAKVPEGLDDDDFAAAEQEERVAAGLEDYNPEQVPAAADPVPPGSSAEAERAQRGLDQTSDEENSNG